ncbi:hypothetical protein K2173_028145 [Erythroxylum novogranatense]|uniref:EF-hand domain-containing protein n=1 Tax=Erythroxylum novogranatense TaxID=1862640 RepID=A0AAV8U4Z2_9ROSI|nr:hypothetical protein K2173_028145 [Erythroxylum novogranatense]
MDSTKNIDCISPSELLFFSVIIIYFIVTILEDICPCSCCSPHSFFDKLACFFKSCTADFSINNAIERQVVGGKDSAQNAISFNSGDGEELSIGEVKEVMGNLGTDYDPSGEKLPEKINSNGINNMLEDKDPSIEEVHDAFRVFDENDDGFINTEELRKVLCKLSYKEITEADCRRIIETYDENGDELIDFNEFVRVMSISLSN